MQGYLTSTVIEAIARETTRLLIAHYYHPIKLPETSEHQVMRVMEELQPRGPDDQALNEKLDKLQQGYIP